MKDKNEIRKLYNLVQEEFAKEIFNLDTYKEISSRYEEIEVLLKNNITKEDFKLFEGFVDVYSELLDFENGESFIKGFSMANRYRDESLR